MSSTQTNWILNLIDKVSGTMKRITNATDKASTSQGGLISKLGKISLQVNQTAQMFTGLNDALSSITASGIAFESSLADVEAITGVTGKALQELGDKARASALKFGGDAAKSVETYKLLLSQLGPDLAKTPEVLDAMAGSVATLSKTMGGDTTKAAEVLTTAMNQYGVSLDDPQKAQAQLNRMMNAMAASAKEGSSELPTLQAAVQNVGGDAKSSGLEFEEMLSSIQALDKAGKKGAEGGVALRNTLSSLNQGRFLPKDVQEELSAAGINLEKLSDKTVPFTDRLRALKPIQNDAALLSKLFGKENKLAAEALLNSVDAQDKMTEQITGTNTATDQAGVIMGTFAEKMARINARFSDFGISLFNATSGILPFIQGGSKAIVTLVQMAPAFTLAKTMGSKFISTIIRMPGILRLTRIRFAGAGKAALLMGKNIFNSGLAALKAAPKYVIAAVQGIIPFVSSLGTAIAAQLGLNAAMTANPIGIIIVAVAALIALIVAIIAKWDEWGAALSIFLGPLGFVISLIQSFRRNWQLIKDAFSGGGIIAGLKAIGFTILDAVLQPVQQLLGLLSKVPGLGFLGKGADSIQRLRDNLKKSVTVEKKQKEPVKDVKTKKATKKATPEDELLKELGITPNNIGGAAANKVLSSSADGGGSGAGKTITMNLEIKQTFNVAGNVRQNIEDIANQTIKIINDKLKDGLALA